MWTNYIRTKRDSTFQITLKDWFKNAYYYMRGGGGR